MAYRVAHYLRPKARRISVAEAIHQAATPQRPRLMSMTKIMKWVT